MADDKVISLPNRLFDGTRWSVKDMLKDALDHDPRFTKGFVILLNDNGKFDTHCYQAGMKMSEIVALLEIMKYRIYHENMVVD
jgi:hypothetical protein